MDIKTTMQDIFAVASCTILLTLHFCIGAPLKQADSASYRYGDDAAGASDFDNASTSATRILVSRQILSFATGQFVAMTKSGSVSGDNPINPLVTHFQFDYMEADRVTIKSVKYSHLGWYLTLNSRGKFRGGIPSNGNEVFEIHSIGPYSALKVVPPPNSNQQLSTNASSSTNQESEKENNTETSSGSGSASGSASGEMENENNSTPNGSTVPLQKQTDCFLGFTARGKPACYDSIHHNEVLLQFLAATPPTTT